MGSTRVSEAGRRVQPAYTGWRASPWAPRPTHRRHGRRRLVRTREERCVCAARSEPLCLAAAARPCASCSHNLRWAQRLCRRRCKTSTRRRSTPPRVCRGGMNLPAGTPCSSGRCRLQPGRARAGRSSEVTQRRSDARASSRRVHERKRCGGVLGGGGEQERRDNFARPRRDRPAGESHYLRFSGGSVRFVTLAASRITSNYDKPPNGRPPRYLRLVFTVPFV